MYVYVCDGMGWGFYFVMESRDGMAVYVMVARLVACYRCVVLTGISCRVVSCRVVHGPGIMRAYAGMWTSARDVWRSTSLVLRCVCMYWLGQLESVGGYLPTYLPEYIFDYFTSQDEGRLHNNQG